MDADEQEHLRFERFKVQRAELVDQVIDLIADREHPGKIDDSVLEVLRILTSPDARQYINVISRFARATVIVQSIWLGLIGFIVALLAIATHGKEALVWLRDFLIHTLPAAPPPGH